MIRISRREGRGGLGWVVVALAVVAALAGCANKQQATPPASEPAATATTTGNGTPFNFHWDSQSNCLAYTPKADSVTVGVGINFNSSADQTITITAPAGCFSAAETTFTVTRGSSPTMTAYSAGSYALQISPTPCASLTGGVGPSVIINSGK